jgi:hypothetical protein
VSFCAVALVGFIVTVRFPSVAIISPAVLFTAALLFGLIFEWLVRRSPEETEPAPNPRHLNAQRAAQSTKRLRHKSHQLAEASKRKIKQKREEQPPAEKWIWVTLLALFVGVGFVFLWGSRTSDGLRNDLPRVSMVQIEATEASLASAESGNQVISAQAEPSGNGGGDEYRVTGTLSDTRDTRRHRQTEDAGTRTTITGELLSHDSEYWYILEDATPKDISIIPVAEATQVHIQPQEAELRGWCDFLLPSTGCGRRVPTITNNSPIGTILTRRPTIAATVQDAETDLVEDDITLRIDGDNVSDFAYAPVDDKLQYDSSNLQLGKHTVTVVATDGQDNKGEKSWSFTVQQESRADKG